ncbi:TlpA family protein disulfide reductase [Butyricimonas faecihominis]|uniref:TlpA family protein disulfide reductase n=1 Tax=Butyricimonas faecihominis TaxID=1472416 RepID=UPI0026DC85A9|nr:TlpA disulfide reductase family protein [Butyricimonas faecihominis]
MKHIILLLGCLGCLFAGCSEPSYRLTVSIYGNGSLPGDTVYLYRFNEETLQFEKGDSAMLDDRQQVCFTGKYTGPEFVCVGVRKKATSKFFMLDSTEVFAYNVLLHEEPNFFNPSGYKLTKKYMIVEGGRESAILDYYQGMERLTLLPDQLKSGDAFKEGVMMDMLVKFPNSRAMLMILNNERKRFLMDRLGEALSLFDSPELIGHPLYKELVAYREAVMKTSVGQVVPDFSLPSMNGEEVAIRSFRGKYVLLDFWASWCGPCIGEMPNVHKAYDLLHDKGFEVISISTDRKESDWRKAMKEKQMEHFVNLRDTKGVLHEIFNRDAIPFILLLDPQGRIVAKELRGKDIYEVAIESMNK